MTTNVEQANQADAQKAARLMGGVGAVGKPILENFTLVRTQIGLAERTRINDRDIGKGFATPEFCGQNVLE